MYFTIHLDHEFAFEPGAAHDDAVRALFHGHMQRQQGFGRGLGPDSAQAMARIAGQRGLVVHTAPSPWRIGADQPAMLHANLDFVDHAVHEMLAQPDLAQDRARAGNLSVEEFDRWLGERRAQIDRGELTLSVGHQDLWITWPEPTGPAAPRG